MFTTSQLSAYPAKPISKLLEDHIDEPIKRAVALLNLYGIGTIFSCCGFSYKGEKVPKSHIHNHPQILFKATRNNLMKACKLIHCGVFASNNMWSVHITPTNGREPFVKALMSCRFQHQSNGQINNWLDKSSPHHHEGANVVIACLEDRLVTFKDEMKDEVLIHDYNAIMKKAYPSWQYDACEPWLVRKKDFIA